MTPRFEHQVAYKKSSKMVRPRLVEEGAPIGSPKRDDYPSKKSLTTLSGQPKTNVMNPPSSLSLALEGKVSELSLLSRSPPRTEYSIPKEKTSPKPRLYHIEINNGKEEAVTSRSAISEIDEEDDDAADFEDLPVESISFQSPIKDDDSVSEPAEESTPMTEELSENNNSHHEDDENPVVLPDLPREVEPSENSSRYEDASPVLPEQVEETNAPTTPPQVERVHFIGDMEESKSAVSPLIPFKEGFATKASVNEFSNWIALALTLDGRDKLTKVLQYTARLLAWWFAGTNGSKRFTAVKESLTHSRKALRLGRSFIELHRLREMGLLELIGLHWEKSLQETSTGTHPAMQRQASSNIGFRPTMMSTDTSRTSSSRKLIRSMSSAAYRIYRPISRQMSIRQDGTPSKDPVWKAVGSALKMLGLLGFWSGDNISFLTASGMFDDYTLAVEERMIKRKERQTNASLFANRSYFVGAIAGFVTNLRVLLTYRRETLRPIVEEYNECQEEVKRLEIARALSKAKEKYFGLLVALVKSTCDVVVFSNNPGIDLWKKASGRKLHEGLHCVLGLLSASTVIYNNFPNAK